jgi:hypothetical protein
MKHYIPTFIFFSFIVFFFSCVSEVDIDSSTIEKELVINGFISPDSLFTIELSQTKVIQGSSSYSTISDATVKLYEDNVEIETLHYVKTDSDSASVYMSSSVYPQVGKTYRIEASHSGYETISCETTIPIPAQIISIDTSSIYSGNQYKIKVTFQDSADVANYYRIVLRKYYGNRTFYSRDTSEDAVFDTIIEINDLLDGTYLDSEDPVFSSSTNADDYLFGSTENKFNLFNDELFEGQKYTINFNFYFSSNYYEKAEKYADEGCFYKLIVQLQSLSYEEYAYLATYENYANDDDEYSLKEPVQVYSNVDNGTGIFASHSMDTYCVFSAGEYPMEGVKYYNGSEYYYYENGDCIYFEW